MYECPDETDGWDLDAAEADAEELCNCRFSLAYGGKILLNSATLRLVRWGGGVVEWCWGGGRQGGMTLTITYMELKGTTSALAKQGHAHT